MTNISDKTDLIFEQSLGKFFREESKSVGYKSGKVKRFINYYRPFYLSWIEPPTCGSGDFLDSHVNGVMFRSVGFEVYRRLILDEDKDWVRYMVETYFSSPKTIQYLESNMMMRGV